MSAATYSGLGDVLAVHPARSEILLVQATSWGHVADRLARAKTRLELQTWLSAGGKFEIWGWQGPRLKRVIVKTGDVEPMILQAPRQRRRQRETGLFDALRV
jgi:hypothetical protein